MIYKCLCCDYPTRDLKQFLRHLNRKYRCNASNTSFDMLSYKKQFIETYNDNSVGDWRKKSLMLENNNIVIGEVNAGLLQEGQNETKGGQMETLEGQMETLEGQMETLVGQMDTSVKKYECPKCHKTLSSNKSLKRHIINCKGKGNFICKCGISFFTKSGLWKHKKKCKVFNRINDQDDYIRLLENKIEDLTTQLINKPQQVNNNNNLNITINAYGPSNMDVLQDKDYITALLKGKYCVVKLIELAHFNKNYPENHNIFKPNHRDEYCRMYDGNLWNLIPYKVPVWDMYENFCNKLEDWMELKKSQGLRVNDKVKYLYYNFLDCRNVNEEEQYKKIVELMYNKHQMIMDVMNKISV